MSAEDVYGIVEKADGSLHWDRLDWLCQCTPDSTPEQELNLLAAWAANNPGCVPTCARCDKPFDLRRAYLAVADEFQSDSEAPDAR